MNDIAATGDTNHSAAPAANSLERHISYSFSAASVDTAVNQKLLQMRKNTRINGFRLGHVPMSIMRQRWEKQCRDEILVNKANTRFQEEIIQSEERVASHPAVTPIAAVGDTDYKVDCRYEVLPIIEAPVLAGRELRQGVLDIGEKEVEQMITRLRRDFGHYHATERAAQKNDRLDVNVTAYRGDELIEKNTKRQWVLGSPMLHSEVTTQLTGAAKGDTRDIHIKHGDNHPHEEMRNVEERLTVTVEAVNELHLPALDAEFFARFNVTEGSEEAFRQLVSERLQLEVRQRLDNYGREQVMALLIEATPKFDLPQSLLRMEVSNLYQQMQKEAQQRGLPLPANALQNIYHQATQRVALGLIMAEWQRRENYQVSKDEVNAILDEMAEAYEDSEKFKAQARKNNRAMQGIHLAALEKQVAQWMQERVTVVEQPLTLGQLLGGIDAETSDTA